MGTFLFEQEMSHRKFEAPRHGSLAFLPRKRCKNTGGRGSINCFARDSSMHPPHLTGFFAFKAGMTHVVREVRKPNSRVHKKEVVEAVTILETPPMVVVGVMGPPKRVITLRKVMGRHPTSNSKEKIDLKLIDTSSKYGSGRFQTAAEKQKFMGLKKK